MFTFPVCHWSGSAFTPPSLPNLQFWIDGADATTISLNYQASLYTVSGTGGSNTFTITGIPSIPLTNIFQGSYIQVNGSNYIVTTITNGPPVTLTVTPNVVSTVVAQALNYGTMSQWNDKSINGYNVVQATAANQPIYLNAQQNGKNTPVFNGSSMIMAVANAPNAAVNISTAVIVASGISVSTFGGFIGIGGQTTPLNNSTLGINQDGSFPSGNFWCGGGGDTGHNGSVILGTGYHELAKIADGTNISGYLDNVLDISPASGAYSIGIPSIQIGAYDPTVGYMNGVVAEAVIYSRVLTGTELTQLYHYFKAKWGTP